MCEKDLHHENEKGSVPIGRRLDSTLVRMVLRVDTRLSNELNDITEHLFNETRLEYSRASIVRGLINIGLASVQLKLLEDPPLLERLFHGARVPRGRKPGARRASAKKLDLTTKDEEEHQQMVADSAAQGGGCRISEHTTYPSRPGDNRPSKREHRRRRAQSHHQDRYYDEGDDEEQGAAHDEASHDQRGARHP